MNLERKVKQNIHKARNDFHFKELLKGSLIAVIFKIIAVLSGYLLFYILAKIYGASGVGFFSFAWTLLTVSVVFSKLGFDTSIVKYIATFAAKKQPEFITGIYLKSLKFIVLSSIIVTSVLLLFSGDLSMIFFRSLHYKTHIIYLTFAILPLTLLNINAESQKALKKITLFSALQNGSINLFLVIIFYLMMFTHFSNNYYSIVFALLLAISFLMIISFVFVGKNIGFRTGDKKLKLTNKNLLKTTIPMLLSNSIFLIMSRTDILILTAFKTEADVGIYNTALKIASLTTVVLIAINTIAMPKFAELKDNPLKFKKFIKQTTFVIILTSLPVFLILVLFPNFFLQIFGHEFTAGKNVLIILSAGMFLGAFSGSTINILNMAGYEKIVYNILLFSAIMNITLNFILIPFYGIDGAAIATAVTTLFWNLAAVVVIYKKFKFLPYPFF